METCSHYKCRARGHYYGRSDSNFNQARPIRPITQVLTNMTIRHIHIIVLNGNSLQRLSWSLYRVAKKKTRNSRFLGLCSNQQLSFFTLVDRASFPHYNSTKIIKFG